MSKERVKIDKDWLIEQYIVNRKNSYELSTLLGCSNVTVLNKLKLFNIPKRTAGESKQTLGCNTALLKNKKWLENAYIKKQLSTFEIADKIKTTPRTVRLALMSFDIPIRSLRDARKVSITASYTPRIKIDVPSIIDSYLSLTSTAVIAKKEGCSQGVIINRLKEAGVDIRSNSEAIFAVNGKNPEDYILLKDKDWLIDKYVNEKLSLYEIARMLGCVEWTVRMAVKSYGIEIINHTTSFIERKIRTFLINNNIEYIANCRTTISPMELDIVIPQCNIAIEVNGVYWHSNLKVDAKYHESKRLACESMGIRLISLYEDDINNRWPIIERIILNAVGKCDDKRVFARKCTIDFNPSVEECKNFLNTWHIQGSCNQNKLISLRNNGDLVAVMAFNGNVLSRYATSIKVIGGFSKLLKNCGINGEIVSFVDLDTFSGGSYAKAGFVFDKYLKPDYKYLVRGNRVHKFSYRLKRFKNDPDLLWEDGLTEKKLAELNGLPKIYNSGMNRMIYNN